ncbi:MAG: DnaJ domain-containing protein [Deltaproteobacteria bacterium]|jgi:molecular chaperone DnaJ|nr:DnaJ domain-containing protein [Deltaproteobacteria bacterium]
MSIDPYKALGVDKKSSQADIKKAYRKLARKYHPDVNPGDKGAEEKFKEVSTAYDILSDPAKKSEYDNLGREAFYERGFGGAGYKQPNFDMDSFPWGDILADLFGGNAKAARGTRGTRGGGQTFSFDDFGSFGQRRAAPAKGATREHTLTLDFMDAVKGMEFTMRLDIPEVCPGCQGTGRTGNGASARICPACHGQGNLTRPQTLKAKVPAGVEDGQKIRLKGKGYPGRDGGPPGDLELLIKVNPDPVFSRDLDNNLNMEKKVSLYTALLGGKVEVPNITGKASLTIPPGTQNGAKFRLKGKGVSTSKKTGDLYVTVKVVLPADLSDQAAELARKLQEAAPLDQDDL